MGNPIVNQNGFNSKSGVKIKIQKIHCAVHNRNSKVEQKFVGQPNNRLELTAPSVHAFCIAAGVEDPGPRGEKACPSARSSTVR
jgi:hypothetical protein